MGYFYPPPPPFIGGRQPHEPAKLAPQLTAVRVDNPPAMGGLDADILNVVLQSWSASTQPVQRGKFFVQSVDNPPAVGGLDPDVYNVVVRSWYAPQPDPFMGGRQPLAQRILPPSITAVRVDNPPAAGALDADLYALIARSWDPPTPNPFMGGRQPLVGRILPPSLLGVRVDNPPPIGGLDADNYAVILQAWIPPPPNPFLGGLQPLQLRNLPVSVTAVAVNNPPLGYRPWLASTVSQWQPPWPVAQGWRYVVQGAGATTVDNPPLMGGIDADVYSVILQAWVPAAPEPKQQTRFFVQSVDNPPVLRQQANAVFQTVVSAWAPPPPPPQAVRYVVQGVRVDNPPPRSNYAAPIAHWLPLTWNAQSAAPSTPPSGAAVFSGRLVVALSETQINTVTISVTVHNAVTLSESLQ